MENHPMEVELCQSDGRTDRHDEVNFAKVRTNYEDTCVCCISISQKICFVNSRRDDSTYGSYGKYLKMIHKSAETCRQW